MPSLERDAEAFLGECEAVPLSLSSPPASPGGSGDFTKDCRLSSYGSTSSTADREAATAPASPTPPAPPKDPEQWPLLGPVLPPPGGWGLGGGAAAGVPLTAAAILPLAHDPFWCRLRNALMGLFWVILVGLLAAVAVIVANDTSPCAPRVPPQALHETFNVSMPIAAFPALQAVAASRS